jgi:hypothetical protein
MWTGRIREEYLAGGEFLDSNAPFSMRHYDPVVDMWQEMVACDWEDSFGLD